MSYVPYTSTVATFGRVKPVERTVIFAERADLIEAVDRTLEGILEEHVDEVEAIVRPVAETMTHFPFGHWMSDAGCGCIVGEHIVAADLIARQDFVDRYAAGELGIHDLLEQEHGVELAAELYDFGNRVDRELRRVLRKHELPEHVERSIILDTNNLVVVFTDTADEVFALDGDPAAA